MGFVAILDRSTTSEETLMRRSLIATPVLAVALISPNLSAQSCNTTNADTTAVTDAVRTLYAGGTVDDMAKMRTVLAPGFYIFDNGHQYNSIDDLMKMVKALRGQGIKFVWNVTNPKVTIHCNDAWITYINDGSIQFPSSPAPTPTQWLESAILEKQDGTWKLVFMQSTRVPPAPPPAM
jgi:SnoaL-like domain